MGALRLPRSFWILLGALFVNRVGGIVGQFASLYLVGRRGFTDGEAGAMLSLYGLGAVAGSFAGGWCADRFGRRLSLIAALGVNAAALASIPMAGPRWLLGLLFGVFAFSNDAARPCIQASIADIAPGPLRIRAFGAFRVAMNLGFAAGSTMGGLLAPDHFLAIFAIDSATAAAAAILLILLFPETRPEAPEGAAAGAAGERGPRARFAVFLALAFLVFLIATQMSSNLPLSLRRRGAGERLYGSALALNGVLVALAQLPMSMLSGRMRLTTGLSLGALLYGCGYGMIGASVEPGAIFLCVACFTFGEMLFVPLASTYTARIAPAALRGRWMGFQVMTWGVARIVAPGAGAAILERWGDRALWTLSPAFGAAAAVGLWLLGRRDRA